MTLGSDGSLYIADSFNAAIRKVQASTGIITTVAGNGNWGYSGDGSLATSASLYFPDAVALDSSGNLYIASYFDDTVREVSVTTGIINTIAGNDTEGDLGDGGKATNAQLSNPQGVAVDALGNVYIADSGGSFIRKIIASSGIITTVAGNGSASYSGHGGIAIQAFLSYPALLTVTSSPTSLFNVYIADQGNNVIRAITSFRTAAPVFSPISATYSTAQTASIGDYFSGATIYYTTDGTTPTTSSSDYSSPVTVSSTETLNAIAAATGYYNSSDSAAAYTISSGVTVSVAPSTATVSAGQTQQFSATVGNSSNTAVTWSISPSGLGSVNSSGLYTAPTSITTQQTVTITAASQADSTKNGSATITLSSTNCTWNGYAYRRVITINQTKVTNSDLTDFPILVSGTYPYLATVANGGMVQSANGYDVIFTSDATGHTLLDFEIDGYNAITGSAALSTLT